MVSNEWQSMLDDVIVRPSFPHDDMDGNGWSKARPIREGSQTDVHQKENVHCQPMICFKKNLKPIKTIPPPAAIKLESIYLTDHIASLQEYALVGRWHFPKMDDTKMRNWLELQWKPLIGYIPIVARLLKEWYCFHFLSASDLEAIQNRPWVYGRSFLALYKWYVGYNPLKNTPTNNLIWVKLPGLPLELWSKETLTEIGNAIGRCVYVDPRCLGGKDKCVA